MTEIATNPSHGSRRLGLPRLASRRRAALGWAFLVWLFGGGLGLALLVFVALKLLGA